MLIYKKKSRNARKSATNLDRKECWNTLSNTVAATTTPKDSPNQEQDNEVDNVGEIRKESVKISDSGLIGAESAVTCVHHKKKDHWHNLSESVKNNPKMQKHAQQLMIISASVSLVATQSSRVCRSITKISNV